MKDRNLQHKDDWATPPYFYDELNKEFDFNFDPCPYKHNIGKWNGLEIEWDSRNFINPPYSRKLKEAFVIKAIEESKKGKLCVMLLPVSTSTKLFHEQILPNKKEIRFVKGRIKFYGINTKFEYVTTKTPMHDSMLVVFDGGNFQTIKGVTYNQQSLFKIQMKDIILKYGTVLKIIKSYIQKKYTIKDQKKIFQWLSDYFNPKNKNLRLE